MDLTYLLIAAGILVLPTILTRMFSGGSGDTKKVMGYYPPARQRTAAKADSSANLRARVHALIAQRRVAEAVKLVQSAASLAPDKAREIVATIQRADAAKHGKRATLPSRRQ